MRSRERYSGIAIALFWGVAVAFGITFWMGVSCLVSNIIKG
jgi:cytochrome b561